MKDVLVQPSLGFGLGLRPDHYHDIINEQPQTIDWFEVLTENYLIPGGKPLYYLDQIVERYPVVMHGVSLSIASTDPLDWAYLEKVKALKVRTGAKWLSDHLCWTGLNQTNLHDLLPVPYTEESIAHIVERIKQVQDFFGERILIENVSSYLSYTASTMSEWDFINAIADGADCLLLLDINNIFVSSFNHCFDAKAFIEGIDKYRVQQFHLAGHSHYGDHIIDTHDHPVIDEVWALYAHALKTIGPVSTMIERDDHIPPLNTLITELAQAKTIAADVGVNLYPQRSASDVA